MNDLARITVSLRDDGQVALHVQGADKAQLLGLLVLAQQMILGNGQPAEPRPTPILLARGGLPPMANGG